MTQLWKAVTAGSLALAPCRPVELLSDREARQIADHAMSEELPQTDLDKYEVETTDLGDSWRLAYSIRGGSTGGVIVFVIDKGTGQIKDAKSWQKALHAASVPDLPAPHKNPVLFGFRLTDSRRAQGLACPLALSQCLDPVHSRHRPLPKLPRGIRRSH